MSTEQKLDFLIKEVVELKSIFTHGAYLNKKTKKAETKKQETAEDVANRLFAKIVTVSDA